MNIRRLIKPIPQYRFSVQNSAMRKIVGQEVAPQLGRRRAKSASLPPVCPVPSVLWNRGVRDFRMRLLRVSDPQDSAPATWWLLAGCTNLVRPLAGPGSQSTYTPPSHSAKGGIVTARWPLDETLSRTLAPNGVRGTAAGSAPTSRPAPGHATPDPLAVLRPLLTCDSLIDEFCLTPQAPPLP